MLRKAVNILWQRFLKPSAPIVVTFAMAQPTPDQLYGISSLWKYTGNRGVSIYWGSRWFECACRTKATSWDGQKLYRTTFGWNQRPRMFPNRSRNKYPTDTITCPFVAIKFYTFEHSDISSRINQNLHTREWGLFHFPAGWRDGGTPGFNTGGRKCRGSGFSGKQTRRSWRPPDLCRESFHTHLIPGKGALRRPVQNVSFGRLVFAFCQI